MSFGGMIFLQTACRFFNVDNNCANSCGNGATNFNGSSVSGWLKCNSAACKNMRFKPMFCRPFVGLIIAVALVARNRTVLRLHVHADLVGAAGFECGFDIGKSDKADLMQ